MSISQFGNICVCTQKELKTSLAFALTSYGYKIVVEDGFIYAKGDVPILLTAHLDTVHKVQVKRWRVINKKGRHIVKAKDGIGGDDRCGVYMILKVIESGYRPSILFCEDEEIGGIGSNKFCGTKYIDDLKEMKYLIELDRANGNDAVYYDCDNKDFIKFIDDTIGYKEAFGTFSDISHLAPDCGVAAVNLSCGYYNAHTTSEYVVFEEMERTIEAVKKLLNTESEKFEYIESTRHYNWGWDYKYDTKTCLEVTYINERNEDDYAFCQGKDENECWLNFFMENPNVCFNQVIDMEVYEF